MSFAAAASRAVDACFRAFGEAATWRSVDPAVGSLAVTVILYRNDQSAQLGQTRVVGAATRLEVRVSEVETVTRGDLFEVGDETFVVQGQARRVNDRLVWEVDLYPQPAS